MKSQTRKALAKDCKDNMWQDHREIKERIARGNKSGAVDLLNDMVSNIDKMLTALSN